MKKRELESSIAASLNGLESDITAWFGQSLEGDKSEADIRRMFMAGITKIADKYGLTKPGDVKITFCAESVGDRVGVYVDTSTCPGWLKDRLNEVALKNLAEMD